MTYQIQLVGAESPDTIAEYICSSGKEALKKVKEILKSKDPREFMLISSYDDSGTFYDSEYVLFKEDIKPAFFI